MNHIFIGLGGTGGKALRELRKIIYLDRGIEPEYLNGPYLEFIHVDTTDQMMHKGDPQWTVQGQDLQLPPSGQVHLRGGTLKDILENPTQYPNIAPWIGSPKSWQGLSNEAINDEVGGQKRRLGRFLLAINSGVFMETLTAQVNKLQTRSGEEDVIFHVVTGLAGGTGSGILIDVLAQIRQKYFTGGTQSRFKLLAYCLLPERDTSWDTGNYHANGYAALLELNAFSIGRYEPFNILEKGQRMRLIEPFSGAYIFSRRNENGTVLNVNDEVPGLIGDFLFQKTVAMPAGGWEELMRMENAENGNRNAEMDPDDLLPERSTRFLSFGIKRLIYPKDEIKEYIMYALGLSIILQLRYNNWVKFQGYLEEAADGVWVQDIASPELQSRLQFSKQHLTLARRIEGMKESEHWVNFEKEWSEVIPNIKIIARKSNRSGRADELSKLAREQFEIKFRGRGVEKFFEDAHRSVDQHAQRILASIETYLFDSFFQGTKGIHDLLEYLKAIQRELEKILNSFQTDIGEFESTITQQEGKFGEEGRLYASVRGWPFWVRWRRQRKHFANYSMALQQFYIAKTKFHAFTFGENLLKTVLRKVNLLYQEVSNISDSLQKAEDYFRSSMSHRCQDNFNPDDIPETAFKSPVLKFYFPDQVQEAVREVLKEDSFIKGITTVARTNLYQHIEKRERFKEIREKINYGELITKIESVCREKAEGFSNAGPVSSGMQLMESDVIDALKNRFEFHPNQMQEFFRKFIEYSGLYAVFNPVEMNKTGPGIKGAQQQTSAFAVLIPRSQDQSDFIEKIKKTVQRERPSTIPQVHFIETHSRSNEICMMSIRNLFPLRYLEDLEYLRKRYESLLASDSKREDKVIHSENDLHHFPSLFAPTEIDLVERKVAYQNEHEYLILLSLALDILKEEPESQDLEGGYYFIEEDDEGHIIRMEFMGKDFRSMKSALNPSWTDLLSKAIDSELPSRGDFTESVRGSLKSKVGELVEQIHLENKWHDKHKEALQLNNSKNTAYKRLGGS